jgi:hypothetical protein
MCAWIFALSLLLLASPVFGNERVPETPSSPHCPDGRISEPSRPSPLAERLRAHVLRLAGEIGERKCTVTIKELGLEDRVEIITTKWPHSWVRRQCHSALISWNRAVSGALQSN